MKTMVSYLLMLQKYQFKVKDSEIKYYALDLGNTSKYFTTNMINAGLKGVLKFFVVVDFNPSYTSNISDIINIS